MGLVEIRISPLENSLDNEQTITWYQKCLTLDKLFKDKWKGSKLVKSTPIPRSKIKRFVSLNDFNFKTLTFISVKDKITMQK